MVKCIHGIAWQRKFEYFRGQVHLLCMLCSQSLIHHFNLISVEVVMEALQLIGFEVRHRANMKKNVLMEELSR